MRVALVASLVSPLRRAEANGPHAVIIDLARGLTARGHRAVVYAAAGSVAEGIEIVQVFVDEAVRDGAVQVGVAAPSAATEALDRGFERLFAVLRRDGPDVVSQHAFDAAALRLAEGLPVLHTLHLPPVVPDVVAAARATQSALATVSAAARSSWRRAGISDLAVLRNGVPDPEPAGGAIAPIALIAGRISPEKGTDIAIRAARRAGLAPLVVGDAYDERYFSDAVAPLLRPGEWVGAVPRAMLYELMARSRLLLMPVQGDEPFGLVAAEAQMAGCPVVAYRRGALPEVVEHGVGGWLAEPDDEAQLVRGIATVRGFDRASIRRRARRRLGVERMVDAYERALAAVAARSTRPTALSPAAAAGPASFTCCSSAFMPSVRRGWEADDVAAPAPGPSGPGLIRAPWRSPGSTHAGTGRICN